MDNRFFDIVGEGDEMLRLAITLAAGSDKIFETSTRATHYRIVKLSHHRAIRVQASTEKRSNVIVPFTHNGVDIQVPIWTWIDEGTVVDEKGRETLILLWHQEQNAQPLPFALDGPGMFEFVRSFLKTADYGRQPDHDGDNGKGWRVFVEGWGHVADSQSVVFAVQPAWAMYGK